MLGIALKFPENAESAAYLAHVDGQWRLVGDPLPPSLRDSLALVLNERLSRIVQKKTGTQVAFYSQSVGETDERFYPLVAERLALDPRVGPFVSVATSEVPKSVRKAPLLSVRAADVDPLQMADEVESVFSGASLRCVCGQHITLGGPNCECGREEPLQAVVDHERTLHQHFAEQFFGAEITEALRRALESAETRHVKALKLLDEEPSDDADSEEMSAYYKEVLRALNPVELARGLAGELKTVSPAMRTKAQESLRRSLQRLGVTSDAEPLSPRFRESVAIEAGAVSAPLVAGYSNCAEPYGKLLVAFAPFDQLLQRNEFLEVVKQFAKGFVFPISSTIRAVREFFGTSPEERIVETFTRFAGGYVEGFDFLAGEEGMFAASAQRLHDARERVALGLASVLQLHVLEAYRSERKGEKRALLVRKLLGEIGKEWDVEVDTGSKVGEKAPKRSRLVVPLLAAGALALAGGLVWYSVLR